MYRKAWSIITIIVVVSMVMVGIAVAYKLDSEGVINSATEAHGHVHAQHGGDAGHLPASSRNVRLIGKMNINQDFPGRVADVGVFGNYAYLGAFNERDCQKGGVYVFDISNPAAPKQINFIRTNNNSYVGEGVQVINITTPQFSGDVLIHNNEICGTSKVGAVGGISLIDVTNPKVHKYLARGVGDFQPAGANGASIAHTVHSAFAWDAGDKAYAVLVDNEEAADVDIMDISDPRAPKLIAEYDLNTLFPQIIQSDLGSGQSFLHDMVVKQINSRFVMLLSYWDGGYVTLDVTNPLNPTYIADSDFTNPDPEAAAYGYTVKPEGNAHQAEFSLNNDYIVAADEDFSPFASIFKITSGPSAGEYPAIEGNFTKPIVSLADKSMNGSTTYIGLACSGSAPPAPEDGNALTDEIAVALRGDCFFQTKASIAEAAGYDGIIVMNSVAGGDGLVLMGGSGETPVPQIPGIFVGHSTGLKILGATEATQVSVGQAGANTAASVVFDGWGYVHLYRNGKGKLKELDTYAIPEAFNPTHALGSGDLSVHEVAMSEQRNDLAYFAYYAGGFRVAKIVGNTNNAKLEEVGHFIDEGGNNFWGVQVWQKDGKEYILASDRDYGVYIFEYTGN
jgi:hypothetical protein